MASSFNLIRNSRVFFTTNVAPGTGVINTSGFTVANSQEIQVLDGFSFSQASNADTVTISEAGATPVRGQRSFNTSLNNVEFSFSTYVRPKLATTVKAEEGCLWNALLSATALGATLTSPATVTTATCDITPGSATAGLLTLVGTTFPVLTVGETYVITGVTGAGASQYNTAIKIVNSSALGLTAYYVTAPTAAIPASTNWATKAKFSSAAWNENAVEVLDTAGVVTNGTAVPYTSLTTALSNKNKLLAFGMVITVDSVTYLIDNCAMDQAVIDFGLEGIATIAWTGKGTALRQADYVVSFSAAADPVITGMVTSNSNALGTIKGKVTDANFITTKLSTLTIKSNIAGASGTSYNLALTGGSITIANGITYVTPANLGVVNIPIGYFTGTRAISGSLTAYLRTGTTNSAGLLKALLAASATTAGVEPKFKMQVEIGGITAGTRVEVESAGAMLQIPSVDAQAVMSTTINFTSQGYANDVSLNAYDLENTNDLAIRYIAIV